MEHIKFPNKDNDNNMFSVFWLDWKRKGLGNAEETEKILHNKSIRKGIMIIICKTTTTKTKQNLFKFFTLFTGYGSNSDSITNEIDEFADDDDTTISYHYHYDYLF